MITSYHHVELNGVKYRLAEGVEGEHYTEVGEPLRPPNAQVIQGTSNVFQMRPDTLVWRISNFVGGEGQQKFDPENPSRMRAILNMDPFSKPGSLLMGYRRSDLTADTTQTGEDFLITWRDEETGIVYGLAHDGTDFGVYDYALTNPNWALASGSNNPATYALPGQEISVDYSFAEPGWYIFQEGLLAIYNTTTGLVAVTRSDFRGKGIVLGDYYYVLGMTDGEVWEASETGVPFQAATSFYQGNLNWIDMCRSENRGYLLAQGPRGAAIYELIPTTAAGEGSVQPMATLPGVRPRGIFYSGGLLYVTTETGALYYIRPGAEYGIVMPGRGDADELDSNDVAAAETLHFLTDSSYLYALDLTSGAYARVGKMDSAVERSTGIMAYVGEYVGLGGAVEIAPFWNVFVIDESANAEGLFFYNLEASVLDGEVITPWHDFSISDPKQLNSIRVQHNMTAAWTATVYARKNGDETDTEIGTITGTGSPTTTVLIPSSEYEFDHLSVRILMEYGTGTVGHPEIRDIEVRASVVQTQKMWQLMLDCADDETGVHGSTSGATKITNIRTLGALAAPFTFKDGYGDSRVGEFETHTVVVDSHRIDLERPGEGTAVVILREQT